jgi:hypothetical protein
LQKYRLPACILRLQNLMAERRERRFFMMVMICYDQHDIRESALSY